MPDKDPVKWGCGACDYRSAEGVAIVEWFDNLLFAPVRSLFRVSNSGAKSPEQSPARHSPLPTISTLRALIFPTPADSRSWYIPPFRYVFDLCITNSWTMDKRDCHLLKLKPMSFRRFRLACPQFESSHTAITG